MLPDGRNKTYSFVAQVADESGLLMARCDPERGSVDGRIHMGLLGGLAMGKLQLGLSAPAPADDAQGGGGQNDQALGEVDFGGQTWTGNIKYGSMGGGLMFGCNYFQSVTKRLALGGEGMYLGANNALLSSYSVKYAFPNLKSVPTEEDTGSFKTSSNNDEDMNGSAVLLANYNAGQGLLSVNYKRIVTPDRVTLGAWLPQAMHLLLRQALKLASQYKLHPFPLKHRRMLHPYTETTMLHSQLLPQLWLP